MDGPWVVYFQNCVRWPQPPSKMTAMSRHSFNIEPYDSMGFRASKTRACGLTCKQKIHLWSSPYLRIIQYILNSTQQKKKWEIKNKQDKVQLRFQQNSWYRKSTCDVNLLSKLSIIFKEWRVIVLFVLLRSHKEQTIL
jgi:hypothetical protein